MRLVRSQQTMFAGVVPSDSVDRLFLRFEERFHSISFNLCFGCVKVELRVPGVSKHSTLDRVEQPYRSRFAA